MTHTIKTIHEAMKMIIFNVLVEFESRVKIVTLNKLRFIETTSVESFL